MERLDFTQKNNYNAIEGAIHLNRYLFAKDICKDQVVLDIACGEGYGSYLMSGWGAKQVYGVDISEESIEIAKEKFSGKNIEYLCKSAEDIPEIKSQSIDVVVSFETIEHVEQVDRYLSEIKRVIKEDGSIIISCPNDWWYFPSEEERNPYHRRKYHYDEFVDECSVILGKPNAIYIGNKVEGFSNIEISRIDEKKPLSDQIKMMEFQNIETYIIEQDENISSNNTSYFLIVWSKKRMKESAVIAPTIFYPNGTAIEHELREMLEDAKFQLENKEKTYLEMLEDAKLQLETKEKTYLEMLEDAKLQLETREKTYLEMLEDAKLQLETKEKTYLEMLEDAKLELETKEKTYLELLEDTKLQLKDKNDLNVRMYQQSKELEALYKQQKQEKAKYKYNYDVIKDQVEEQQKRILDTNEKYKKLKQEYKDQNSILQEIYRSKAWRLIRKYYNVWDRMKRIK